MLDKLKSDEEIDRAANKEWMDILVRLWEAIDKPVDAKRLQIYSRELSNVPMGLLELAVSRCVRENTWTTVPSVGKVWEAIRKELHNPFDIEQAIEHWKESLWRRCSYGFGEV